MYVCCFVSPYNTKLFLSHTIKVSQREGGGGGGIVMFSFTIEVDEYSVEGNIYILLIINDWQKGKTLFCQIIMRKMKLV